MYPSFAKCCYWSSSEIHAAAQRRQNGVSVNVAPHVQPFDFIQVLPTSPPPPPPAAPHSFCPLARTQTMMFVRSRPLISSPADQVEDFEMPCGWSWRIELASATLTLVSGCGVSLIRQQVAAKRQDFSFSTFHGDEWPLKKYCLDMKSH